MLQHTNPLSLNWSWYWETFIKSSCQNAQFLRSKNKIYDEALANKHTLNWDSEKIRTRRGTEPRASRCPKIDKKVINSSNKCLISVKIARSLLISYTYHRRWWMCGWYLICKNINVNWLCVFLEVNPYFQSAHIFCMDLQPAADPYNVVYRPTCKHLRRKSVTNEIWTHVS